MRQVLLVFSLIGFLLFGAVFALSLLSPLTVERAAREILRLEIERRVGDKIDTLSDSRIVGLAQRALRKTDSDIEATQRAIRDELPSKVANVVADMLNNDCECRKRLVAYATRAENERLSHLNDVRAKLASLIESTYASVRANLLREFRIFTASNAAAFAVLWLVTYFRRRAALQLILPAIVLIGAVLITGSLYLFKQQWLHTIIFNDYVGLAYAGYLAAVALLLADIVINKARITTHLVNFALEVVGSAAKAVPC